MPKTLAPGWHLARLNDLGTIERGRSRHRPRNASHLYGGIYPFVQTGDVKAAGLRLDTYSQTYNEAGLEQSRLWPAGTLCITIAANICDTTILGMPACFPDSIVGFTPDEDAADVVFVKYALDVAKRRFTDISRGATQDNLSIAKMLSQQLPVPPLSTQRRIASILSGYDDLIMVNNRRIALLEEMSRRLFDEWFVHLRFPGHESHKMVRTRRGRMPEGWGQQSLDSIASVNGRTLRPADAPERVRYIDIASVSPGCIDQIAELPFANAPGRARRLVQDGSILWSTVRPNRRSYAVVLNPADNLVVSTGFAVLDAAEVPFSYLLMATTTDAFVGYLAGRATGAAYPAVTGATFAKAQILVPSRDILDLFASQTEPQIRLSARLRDSNLCLVVSRDLLLPRLISGDLSVAAGERDLEAAA